jgi:hypothetical protein
VNPPRRRARYRSRMCTRCLRPPARLHEANQLALELVSPRHAVKVSGVGIAGRPRLEPFDCGSGGMPAGQTEVREADPAMSIVVHPDDRLAGALSDVSRAQRWLLWAGWL